MYEISHAGKRKQASNKLLFLPVYSLETKTQIEWSQHEENTKTVF